MDNTLKIIFIAIWLPQAVSQVLTWTFWWQKKEYRTDRFKVLLKSGSGRASLGFTGILLKIIAILISPIAALPLGIIFVLDIRALLLIIARMHRKPLMTQRLKKILTITTVGIFVLIALTLFDLLRIEFALILMELYLLLGIQLGIIWTKSIVDRVRKKEIHKAKIKLQKINPKVIGITGSYGKSTTKEFLAHILSSKFRTEKTSKNQNNEFGVSRKILNDFLSDAEIFVAEMGAYTKNEIKLISDFTHPEIGIITGLEPQHLELFGSYEAIMDAKFELIEALPEKGVAVFNVSNDDCERLAQRAEELPTKLSVVRYKLIDNFKAKRRSDAESRIVKITKNYIEFEFRMKSAKKRFRSTLAGAHFVENLTGVIYIARTFGVSWESIEKSIKTISTPDSTMDTYILKDGTIVIDDTANANPKGFIAAVKYLDTFQNKNKVIVTSGIIELGKYSHTIHQDIGQLCRDSVDIVVLTNPDFALDIAKGLGDKKSKLIVEQNASRLTKSFSSFKGNDWVILMEGRLPSIFKRTLEENK